jgi:transposase
MTVSDQQIGLLMKNLQKNNLKISAAKSGISEKTARRYIKKGSTPSTLKKERAYKTRQDPFKDNEIEIREMLEKAPELQAYTVLDYLIEKYPERYNESHGRTLRRRLRLLKAEIGKNKEVIFSQNIQKGKQSQSDWTSMNDLYITIQGQEFDHLLFHFMLPYSKWESVMLCYSESFETLTNGLEKAFFELQGVLPEHRTDNLSAATQVLNNSRTFTQKWMEFCNHYNINPSRNNPGISHENGSVEKSHDLLKKSIDQHLHLRGNRNFESIEDYKNFLESIIFKRNVKRKDKFLEEIPFLKSLPLIKYTTPQTFIVTVSCFSTIRLCKTTYSVPSRLIGYKLKAYVYNDKIELYYGSKVIESFDRQFCDDAINYQHVIDHLIRKPKAFDYYKYKEAFFPHLIFKKAYDFLKKQYPEKGDKFYLHLLHMAKMYGEHSVLKVLTILDEQEILPLPEVVKNIIDCPLKKVPDVFVLNPNLSSYDELLTFKEEGQTCH